MGLRVGSECLPAVERSRDCKKNHLSVYMFVVEINRSLGDNIQPTPTINWWMSIWNWATGEEGELSTWRARTWWSTPESILAATCLYNYRIVSIQKWGPNKRKTRITNGQPTAQKPTSTLQKPPLPSSPKAPAESSPRRSLSLLID